MTQDYYKVEDDREAYTDTIPRDLSSADVRFKMEHIVAEEVVVNSPASVTSSNSDSSDVEYDWSDGDLNRAGLHEAEWKVTYSDGDTETFPKDDQDNPKIDVSPTIASGPVVDPSLARVGPHDVYEFNELGSDPAAPAADDWGLFFKNDGNLYKIDENGTVSQVGGGGSAIVLDLGDGGTDESTSLSEIATVNDSNNVVTEPSADKALIDFSQNWPQADTIPDEEIEDTVNALLTGGTNVSLTYDDANDTLTISATDTTLTNEEVEDIVGALITAGNALTGTYDDANDSYGLSVDESAIALGNLSGDTDDLTEGASNVFHTDERAQDAVGTILDTTLTYDDAAPSLGVASSGIGTTSLDLSISPTWTGAHTFDGAITGFQRAEPGSGAVVVSRWVDSTSGDELRVKLTTSGLLKYVLWDSSAAVERDLWQVDPATQQVDQLATLAFPDLTGTPTFAGHDHSEGGLSTIPNAGLTNDSVTVASGNAMTGGGSPTLGGTGITLDVDESAIDIGNLAGVLVDAVIKTAGDALEWQVDANDDLVLQNTTDATTLVTIDQDTGDITFDALTGSPSFGGHDHSAGGTTAIPNAGLVNTDVTVSTNSPLSGGGSATLGGAGLTLDIGLGNGLEDNAGSLRVNPAGIAGDGLKETSATSMGVEPADFAGDGLVDDGADDLATQVVSTQTANYTASEVDVVLADASGGALTVTLPAASTAIHVDIKKIDSSANAVTIATPNSETIDGQSSLTLSAQYASRTIVSDGSNYFII